MNEFETWASGPQFGLTAGHFVKNEAGAYLNYPTQCYFEVWQAARATTCPGHGRSECVSCCWPKGMCTYLGNDSEGHKQAESYNAGLRAAQYQNLSAATWDGSGLPPVGLPVEAYFPRDTQPVWLTTKLLYVSDENVVYDDGGFGEIRKTRAEFDYLNVQFRKVQS